jgi:hypothetical protein
MSGAVVLFRRVLTAAFDLDKAALFIYGSSVSVKKRFYADG